MAKGKYEYWLTNDGLLLLSAWARDGLILDQIAKNMGIAVSTLHEWKKNFTEISDALKRNKNLADIEVENALHKRALGYEYDEVTFEHGVEVKRVKKQVAPDTTAQIFWLKNRKPPNWRDRPASELTNYNDTGDDGFIKAMIDQTTNIWEDDRDGEGEEPAET